MPTHAFETDYYEAREQFIAAADNAGLRTMRVRVSYENQPELFIDFALDKRDPDRLLLQLSGVHGIEGYCGSAIQRSVLSGLPKGGPSLLFVHAVNPYGMANYRRANGNNVDLNRSFNLGPVANEDYRHFNPYLNPESRLGFATGLLQGIWARFRLGETRTRQAVAAGQMDFPGGLFFTGRELQREVLHLQDFLRSHFPGAKELLALDIHTGLGNWKGEMLFVDHDRETDSPDYFSRIFGRAPDVPDPDQGSYSIHGRISDAIRQVLPGARLHYCLQEFGTLPARAVIDALRKENFEWKQRPPGTLPSPLVRQAMLDAFLPEDTDWRSHVHGLGLKRWEQAFAALSQA